MSICQQPAAERRCRPTQATMMPTAKAASPKQDQKRQRVLDTALNVFARYGFRRTTMSDIAGAAGISRPALYLMFENKEDLFRGVATSLQVQAIERASNALEGSTSISQRVGAAVSAYEETYYAPVAGSPHGQELTDINMSIAADLMREGRATLIRLLSDAMATAEADQTLSFDAVGLRPAAFAELMLSSISGIKPNVSSSEAFMTQSKRLVTVFMASLTR